MLLPLFLLPVVKPKVASAPVNTLATNVISEFPAFLIIGNSKDKGVTNCPMAKKKEE